MHTVDELEVRFFKLLEMTSKNWQKHEYETAPKFKN